MTWDIRQDSVSVAPRKLVQASILVVSLSAMPEKFRLRTPLRRSLR